MKCKSVQTWLLQVETLHVKDWPRNMNRHLKRCAACAKIARQLYKLEEGWRNQPVPEGCDQAKAAFLEKLSTLEQPEKREKPARREKRVKPAKLKPTARRWSPLRWAAAAAVLLIGISGWLFWPAPSRAASSDVVDRLIDWNVKMTNAEAKDRKQLLQEHEANFQKDLQTAALSAEERELAEELFKSGRELASTDDPIVEAEVVKRIADKLYSHAERAETNEHEFERCGMRYWKFKENGWDPMKARIAQFKFPEPKKGGPDKGGFDKGGFKGSDKGSNEYWMNQKKQFEKIFERSPEYARPDLNKRFDGFGKKGGGPGGKMGGKK